jgi:hypothetical protein
MIMRNLLKFKCSVYVLWVAILLFILSMVTLLTGTANADPGDLFVSVTGSGLDCTQSDPCVLETAISKAKDGDAVYLAGGTYYGTGAAVVTLVEDVSLFGGWDGSNTLPIILDPMLHPTVLDGQDTRRVLLISSGASPILDGLSITQGYGDYSGGGISSENSHPTIQNCIIEENHADGDGGGIFINRGSAQILNNQVLDNSANWAGGLRIINNPQVTVKGNFISGNTANISAGGVHIDCCGGSVINVEENWITGNNAGGTGGGVVVANTNAVLVNNIIAENTASEGAGIYLEGMEAFPVDVDLINNSLVGSSTSDQSIWMEGNTDILLTNNLLSNFSVGVHDNNPLSNVINADHNLFFNTSDPILGTNFVQADPLLDARYHLTGGSPAINAGAVVQNSSDIDGDLRPNGMFDLGADEYYPYLYLPFLVSSAGSP